jgi:hypothetical protein
MKAPQKARKVFTNDELLQLLKDEKAKSGLHVYTDKRKTIEEMLRVRGIKF